MKNKVKLNPYDTKNGGKNAMIKYIFIREPSKNPYSSSNSLIKKRKM